MGPDPNEFEEFPQVSGIHGARPVLRALFLQPPDLEEEGFLPGGKGILIHQAVDRRVGQTIQPGLCLGQLQFNGCTPIRPSLLNLDPGFELFDER